jgi:hypothetical protein
MMASRVIEHCKPEDRANRKTSRPRNRKQQHDNRGRARSRSWDQLAQHYSRHLRSLSRSLSTRARASTYRPSGSTHHLRYPLKQKGHSIPSDITLPKNFENPLTCFFWHANGRCNKRDEDCNYAHWETGFLAVAPVNGGSSLMDGMYIPFSIQSQKGVEFVCWDTSFHYVDRRACNIESFLAKN